MMTLLLRNWRQSAELIVIAPTVEVAQNAFAPARDMVKHDEELSELLNVQEHIRTITHRLIMTVEPIMVARHRKATIARLKRQMRAETRAENRNTAE